MPVSPRLRCHPQLNLIISVCRNMTTSSISHQLNTSSPVLGSSFSRDLLNGNPLAFGLSKGIGTPVHLVLPLTETKSRRGSLGRTQDIITSTRHYFSEQGMNAAICLGCILSRSVLAVTPRSHNSHLGWGNRHVSVLKFGLDRTLQAQRRQEESVYTVLSCMPSRIWERSNRSGQELRSECG